MPTEPTGTPDTETLIRRFLQRSRRPALWEPGEELLELTPENYLLERHAGRLILQAWDDARTTTRRVVRIAVQRPGRLEIEVERFARRTGRLVLVDLASAARTPVERHAGRLVLRERLRMALARQWPRWEVPELSAEPDLEHSLSPVFPRALLQRGSRAWAALMAPETAAAGALSFGLVWLDYLRRRERSREIEGLVLFLPDGREHATCLRLAWLDPHMASYQVFVYTEEGGEEPVDPADYGNLDTALGPPPGTSSWGQDPSAAWLAGLRGIPGIETVSLSSDVLSLRARGLEFARVEEGGLRAGIGRKKHAAPESTQQVARMAIELSRVRDPQTGDPRHPFYRLQPERWLESQVRAAISRIDPTLLPEPIYSQVPAMAGCERDVVDLLAVDRRGRLAVLELKASADIHLPLQALDYWLRVRWHLERGEFEANGYFPRIELRRQAPRLLLVAPALEFHPTTETILRYFRPEIEVERIGLGVEWRKDIQIVFRARGAQAPDC
ncbi:MAG: hypothetical protein RMI94_10165 [Bryobacterales bacterium]|nr:hypothetical protein [Bryobacteraceae bacterium]MDW8130902.1 hypothetical protein [Bryobacterales bacterium]